MHYSVIDNDDTLAAYAEKNGAAILSRDRDFFRYRNHTYKIYWKYKIYREGKGYGSKPFLNLFESSPDPHRAVEPRDLILEPLPPTISEANYPLKYKKGITGRSRRGNPSAITRFTGNLQVLLRPLRSAMFSLIIDDPSQPIQEIMPDWDFETDSVKWVEESMIPDNKLAYLL